MIYTLPFQSEDLLKAEFLNLRDIINPSSDIIHLVIAQSQLQDLTTEDIYKKLLNLDGTYRTTTKKWNTLPIKVKVIQK